MDPCRCTVLAPFQYPFKGCYCMLLVAGALSFQHTSIEECRVFHRFATNEIKTFRSYTNKRVTS